ncbi:MAG: permease-like cell division protein FtsX [Cyanobium sp. MAG06]|nr:permease-like cell division protein FtsX [Cyanobium sp. MAG06]
MFEYTINKLKNKIDISIYFKPNIEDDEVARVRSIVQSFAEVKNINYVSAEERFAKFKENNKNDSNINNTLETIGINPLGASLVIQAKDSQGYTTIYEKINTQIDPSNNNSIDKVSYLDVKDSIDNLNSIVT